MTIEQRMDTLEPRKALDGLLPEFPGLRAW